MLCNHFVVRIYESFYLSIRTFLLCFGFFFFSSRRRHTRCLSDWSSDVCSSDLYVGSTFLTTNPGSSTQTLILTATLTGGTPDMFSLSVAIDGKRPGSGGYTPTTVRSEERRVGKECRCRWATNP